MQMRNARRGFTLIELLVVIAIIAILAAILFPVFAKAREKARQTMCLSNLKQISMGWVMYATDYDGKMPGFTTCGTGPGCSYLNAKVVPYLSNKNVFNCPSAPRTQYAIDSYGNTHYGAMYDLTGVRKCMIMASPMGLDDFPSVSNTILLAESRYFYDPYWNDYGMGVDLIPVSGPWGYLRLGVHNGGSNFGFADGHAKWFKAEAGRTFFLGIPGDGIGETLEAQQGQQARAWWY